MDRRVCGNNIADPDSAHGPTFPGILDCETSPSCLKIYGMNVKSERDMRFCQGHPMRI